MKLQYTGFAAFRAQGREWRPRLRRSQTSPLPQVAQAQIYDEDQLSKVEKIFVVVEDDVIDGCLPSPKVLKVEAELILRRSGITVTDEGSDHPAYTLEITPNGFTPSSALNCTANIEVQLFRFEDLSDKTLALVVAEHASIFIGPKSGFQNQLRTFVNQAVTTLANEILKARGQ